METFITVANSPLGKTILALLIFGGISFIGVRITLLVINNISKRVDPNALHWNLLKYFAKIAWALIFILGIVETLPYLSGISTTLVACSSVLVAAIGLASQDILKDAIDGIFISLFKPFSVGDRIRLVSRDITGVIQDINFRFTSIKTVENNLLMIPNSVMNDEIIENSNIVDTKIKAFIDLEVAYDSDIKQVKSVLTDIAINNPLFVDNRTKEEIERNVSPVVIMVRQFAASGIQIRMTVCSANISDSFQLCSDIREGIIERFRVEGISIPYQTIEIIKHE